MLSQDVDWYLATALFGVPMAGLMIQNVYILHDVLHGATFSPYEWQKYITHCWADHFSLPWEELVLEHQRHHASTVDLLVHGEFGWDPAGWLYVLQVGKLKKRRRETGVALAKSEWFQWLGAFWIVISS